MQTKSLIKTNLQNTRAVFLVVSFWALFFTSFAQQNALDSLYSPAKNSPYVLDTKVTHTGFEEEYDQSISFEPSALLRGALLVTYERSIKNNFSAFVSIGPKIWQDKITATFNNGRYDGIIGTPPYASKEVRQYLILTPPFYYKKGSPLFQIGMRLLNDQHLKGRGLEFMYRAYSETFYLPKQNGQHDIGYSDIYTSEPLTVKMRTSSFYLGYRVQGFWDSNSYGFSVGFGLRTQNTPALLVIDHVESNNRTYSYLVIDNNIRRSILYRTFLFSFSFGFGIKEKKID